MFGRVAEVIARLKRTWAEELDDESIRQACHEAGHEWRERKLDPVTTVRLFLLQILWGNAACNQVPHLGKQDVTGSAYCEARRRLPLPMLQTLLVRSTERMTECAREAGRWLGHRLFLTDGSTFSMPDTDQLREHFGLPGGQRPGCGFPTAHFLALMHFGSGLFQKVLPGSWKTHDLSQGVLQDEILEALEKIEGSKKGVTEAEINQAMKDASDGKTFNGSLKGVLGYNTLPLVSIDFNHNPASSTFDSTQTKVMPGNFVRVLSWYDNEWGFSNRMLDTLVAMGKLL